MQFFLKPLRGAFPCVALSALLVLAACGRAQYNIQGMSNGAWQEGSLTVNSGNCYGSTNSLIYGGKSYGISGSSSQSARDQVNQLETGGGGVAAYSTTYCSKTYRVWFSGTFTRGACSNNPSYQCDLVALTGLQAF